MYTFKLEEIFLASEATELWGLADGTVRKCCREGRFPSDYCKKSGKPWIVTKEGMDRTYGCIIDRIRNEMIKAERLTTVVYSLYLKEEVTISDIKEDLPLPPNVRQELLSLIRDKAM